MELIIDSATHGIQIVFIDDEDAERVKQYCWHIGKNRKNLYVIRNTHKNGKRVVESLHRFIMGNPPGMSIDHKNGNTLDNRKVNLRICDQIGNARNRKPNRLNTTGYKGVHAFRPVHNGKQYFYYIASIHTDHKRITLGYFKTKEEAARVYNAAALKYHGEFACLNEVPVCE